MYERNLKFQLSDWFQSLLVLIRSGFNSLIQTSSEIEQLSIFLIISVAELPTDHVDSEQKFLGAKAVTSASGQGSIVQFHKNFYELICEISGCSWRTLSQKLLLGVQSAVMMTLPPDYIC